VIRIRPGRSWRLNPGYLGELRALTPPRARAFTGAEILDVLGLEIDGVDIAAGVGEAQVLVAVDELVQALLRLGQGHPAAQATIGPGPTELLLEARGYDVLATLVSLAPPLRLLASGLLLDFTKLRAATLAAARGLLFDLISISPLLEKAPLARRLSAGCRTLSRKPFALGAGWPAATARALTASATGLNVRCEISAPAETMARIVARREVEHAPLAAHLGRGTVTLRVKDAPALSSEEPLLFTLRNAVRDAAALVEAWEGGDRVFTLPLGAVELRCDLTRDEVRADGWKHPASASPAELALAVAGAAQSFADRALRTAARTPDELLADLRARARALLRHCRDLASGDLRRAPLLVSAPPPSQAPRPLQPPLAEGRIRRLLYRESWREPGLQLDRAPVLLPQGPLLLVLSDAIEAREVRTGQLLWRVPAAPGARLRDGDLFYAEAGDALVRLDAHTGEVRFRRRIRGATHPAQVWPLFGGVLRSLPGEGVAFVNDEGALAWRARLPGGAPATALLLDSVLLLTLASGAAAGLDPADGRVLWRKRGRFESITSAPGRALLLGQTSLAAVDPVSGQLLWERPLPPGASDPRVAGDLALFIAAGRVHALALLDGPPRFSVTLPWAQDLAVADEPDEHGHRGVTVVVTGAGGAALRLDERGQARWTLPTSDTAASAEALLQRGVVLLQRNGTALHDAAEGLPLTALPAARWAALAPDLTCALVDQSGSLAVHRLATHLSVV
jgi:hypothetical protein